MAEREEVTIRLAGRAELPQIVRLLADDPLGARRESAEDSLPDYYGAAFDRITDDPNNELVVAFQGDTVIGCLQLTFIPGLSRRGMTRAQIESVRVARSARGSGVGRALIGWAIDRARAEGCGLVQLTTDKQRPDAHGFYESLGFLPSHEGMKLAL